MVASPKSESGGAMLNRHLLFAALASSTALTSPVLAEEVIEGQTVTIEQAASVLQYSGGNDRMRVEIAPNYSEELGWSLKGAAGGYLTDEVALGLIVEYGEDKREYLANAGIQFTDALSLIGTVGMLEEHTEFVDGEGEETAQQMEYGASLKGAYEYGILSGFELNGYLADADVSSDSVEAGKLYGVQLMADFDPLDTTHIKLGGGYEWLEWEDTNDTDESWTFAAEGTQQLSDVLSLNGHAKFGVSEFVYGGGVSFDLSGGGSNTNVLAFNYSYIDGRDGIENDQRFELGWTYGFGAGPETGVAAADLTDKSGTIRATADVAAVSPANNLLSDVMKRPAFLPERVLARAKAAGDGPLVPCSEAGIYVVSYQNINDIDIFDFGTLNNQKLVEFGFGVFEAPKVSLDGEELSGLKAFDPGYWGVISKTSRTFITNQQYTLTINGQSCLITAREIVVPQ